MSNIKSRYIPVLLIVPIVLFLIPDVWAQHNHHAETEQAEENSVIMHHAFSRNLPMNRNGSGTSWLPDNAPMYGYMQHSEEWMYMLHGNFFLRYNNQDVFESGNRGADKVDALNWLMGMGQRIVGERGLLRLSAMISLEPFTVGGEGYPLLFQTGETWQGEPLIDRQHPHDFFSELSVGYTHQLSPDADVFAFIGYPGEPALGGTVYMHRPSGLNNPDSPLGHHWQDATHITFGVVTLGLRYRNWKIDGSLFNGREPDEERYGFDEPRLNSYSGRLSFSPSSALTMQVSHAFINSPEISHPEDDVYRTTASVLHSVPLRTGRFLNSAVVWGYNFVDQNHNEHSVLAESALDMRNTSVYGRFEWVEKSTEELGLNESVYGHDTLLPATALTLGANQNLLKSENLQFAVGVQGSIYFPDDRLTDIYGEAPVAAEVYIRISPRLTMSPFSSGSDKEHGMMNH